MDGPAATTTTTDDHVLPTTGRFREVLDRRAEVDRGRDHPRPARSRAGALELHPIVVTFAFLLGAQLAGAIGAIVAIPLAAVVQAFVVKYLERYRAERGWPGPRRNAAAARRGAGDSRDLGPHRAPPWGESSARLGPSPDGPPAEAWLRSSGRASLPGACRWTASF